MQNENTGPFKKKQTKKENVTLKILKYETFKCFPQSRSKPILVHLFIFQLKIY